MSLYSTKPKLGYFLIYEALILLGITYNIPVHLVRSWGLWRPPAIQTKFSIATPSSKVRTKILKILSDPKTARIFF